MIDVGVREPANFGLGELRLSGEVLSKNSPLGVECDLLHVGPGGERAVELYLLDPADGRGRTFAAASRSRSAPASRSGPSFACAAWRRACIRAI